MLMETGMFSILLFLYISLSQSAVGATFVPRPVGVWMLNEDSLGKDQSGFGNDASLYDVTLTDGPTGEKKTAYQFHGRSTSYLRISGSTSMDVGANGSFAFTAFIKLQKNTATFIEYVESNLFGMHIWSFPSNNLYANIPRRSPFSQHQIQFSTLQISLDTWTFIGVSYDMRESSTLTGMVGSKIVQKNPGAFTVYTQAPKIIIGQRSGHSDSYLLGGMSCAMLFTTGLSVSDMNRAKRYCLKQARPNDSTFKKFAVGDIPSNHRLQDLLVASSIECLKFCQTDNRCMSASYRSTDGACATSNIDFFREPVQLSAASNVVVYSVVFSN